MRNHVVNTMLSEERDLVVIERDAGSALYEESNRKIRRHALCSKMTEADPILERKEVAVRRTVVLVLAAVLGLSILGLVNGFALAEARILFLAILGLSVTWMLSSWGQHSGSI
jgi:hypothetical protein